MSEDRISLIHKAKGGDEEALSLFVEENLGLVHACVRRFRFSDAEEEDLFQIGCLGLLKAVKRFDESLGLQFSTYAVPVILGEIRRFLRDDGWVKVSRSVKETARNLRKTEERLFYKKGRTPTLSEVATEMGISAEEAAFAAMASAPAHSLEESVHDGGSTPILLKEVIPAVGSAEEESLNRVAVSALLRELDEREKLLVFCRYYQGKTQGETAKILATNQVGVSRLEKKILMKLRKNMEKENL